MNNVLKNRTIGVKVKLEKGMNMRIKLLHGLLSGVVAALVFGFLLIPSAWKMTGQNGQFGPPIPLALQEIVGTIASVAIILAILLSFVLVKRLED